MVDVILGPAIAETSSAAHVALPTVASAPLGPAIAETSSAVNVELPTVPSAPLGPAIAVTSSMADAAPLVSAPAVATEAIGPAVLATSSAADAPQVSQFVPVASSPQPSGADFVAPQIPAGTMWFAPAVDAAVPQWFASFAPADTFGVPAMQTSSPSFGSEGIGISAIATSSVFSSGAGDSWGGGGDGSFVVGGLPFMQDMSFDDTPVYVASDEPPWIFVSDFSGDGWFFV